MKLYAYYRSSTSYRARIALNLKGFDYEIVPVNLLKGEQRAAEYLKINPLGSVPTLRDGEVTVSQSLALAEYLDDAKADAPLVAGSAADKAYVRQIALTMACDIHPLSNTKTMAYLKDVLEVQEDLRNAWIRHWLGTGVGVVEALLRGGGRMGRFALGDAPGLADLCIVPQMYSLRRFRVPVDDYPLCRMIEANCLELPDFQRAAPEVQPDAPADLEPIHGPSFRAA